MLATSASERPSPPTPEAEADPDVALARALLDGDPSAPNQAWNRFSPLVRAIVSRAFAGSPEVDDITQEIFLRLFTRFGTLRDPAALRSFVVSFALRIVKWERKRRRARRWLRLTDDGQMGDFPLLVGELETRYELQRLYGLLDRLSPRERRVLMLRHAEGLKLTEIAAVMQMSLATIKRELKRASASILALNGQGRARRRQRFVARTRPRPPVAHFHTRWTARFVEPQRPATHVAYQQAA